MMFKNIQFKLINFVSTNTYSKWLKDRGIHKRNIRLGCPQSNGCIERYHKIIDDEWGYLLKKCETFEDVFNVCKTCSTYYNYSRNHYYHELWQKRYGVSYKDRFMIPVQSIERIKESQNTHWVSTKNYKKLHVNYIFFKYKRRLEIEMTHFHIFIKNVKYKYFCY